MFASSQQQVPRRGTRRSSRLCDHARRRRWDLVATPTRRMERFECRSHTPGRQGIKDGRLPWIGGERSDAMEGRKGKGRPESRRRLDFGNPGGHDCRSGRAERFRRPRRRAFCCTSVRLVEETTTAGRGRATAGGKIRGSFKASQSSEGAFSIYLLALVDAGRVGAGGRRFSQPHGGTLPVHVKAVAPGVPRSVAVTTPLLRSLARPLDKRGTVGVVTSAGTCSQSPSASGDSAGLSRVSVARPRREGIRSPRRVRHGCRLTRLAGVGGEHRAASPSSQRGVSSGQIFHILAF